MSISTALGLFITASALNMLLTEAIKAYCNNKGKTYSANLVALISALVFGVAFPIAYCLWFNIPMVSHKITVTIISLCILNWIGAMIGYDKVVQTLTQIRGNRSENK